MKNKNLIILIAVLLLTFLVSASALYKMLSEEMNPDNLLIQHQSNSTASDTEMSDNDHSSDDTPASDSSENAGPGNSSDENAPLMAPDFTVYDADGNTVRLSDFVGKPVVLNFWASWCGPCKMEMPAFEELYKEYKDDIHFVMINLTDGSRETVEIASTFLSANNYTFPVYYDKDTDAAWAYEVYGIPVTYFINAEGHLIAQGTSALDTSTLRKGIELISE